MPDEAPSTGGDTTNTLVNLGNFAKPVNTFIERISDAVGGLFAPHQVKRMAKAEAEAQIIKFQAAVEMSDLGRRAAQRRIMEDALHQGNMEAITARALPEIKENATPEKMEDEWIANFFQKARIVSNEDMQGVWARILAGEANSPGTYSKRTVNFLSDLDKQDADSFTLFCSFVWTMPLAIPIIFDIRNPIYRERGLIFSTITHLEAIGLIRYDATGGFQLNEPGASFRVSYYGNDLMITMPREKKTFPLGHALLTQIGRELARICGAKPAPGFFEYVQEQWKEFLPQANSAQPSG